MIKFFRKIRQSILSEGKTGKYFKYAIGEIILVVIGILIALQINNWNEKNKDHKKLLDIYTLVYNDIENDLQDLGNNLEFYNQKKFVFDKVLYDSITPDLLNKGISRLMGDNTSTTLNTTGVNQLRELQNKDSLMLNIIEVYNNLEKSLLNSENIINSEMLAHANYLRDSYDWYPEWINNTIMIDIGSSELHDYFLNSSIYRNRVVSIYQQVYNTYVPILETMIKRLTEIQNELERVLNINKRKE